MLRPPRLTLSLTLPLNPNWIAQAATEAAVQAGGEGLGAEEIATMAGKAASAAVRAMGGMPEEAAGAGALEAQKRGASRETQEAVVQASLAQDRPQDLDAVAAQAARNVAESPQASTAEMGIAAAAAMVESGNPNVNTPEGAAAACAKVLRDEGCSDDPEPSTPNPNPPPRRL